MIDPLMNLAPDLLRADVKQEPIRDGFGRGLRAAARANKNVVGLCADLTESTRMNLFAEAFPDRFFEVGVAEQNLVTAAAGMALAGKIPFVSSYATFSPGRNWEQIRTTICINQVGVKLAGSHAGVSVGPDGATHQALEDIALMRVLPHMTVIAPCDALQAERATIAMTAIPGPAYIRLSREKTPVITTPETPFALGKAHTYRRGDDLTIIATGTMVYHALMAAEELAARHGVEAEVINVAVIKPLDAATIVASARRTGAVLTAEEHQVAGGLGGAVAELLSEQHPVPLTRMGMMDRFGESGQPAELMEHFGLTAPHIVRRALELLKRRH